MEITVKVKGEIKMMGTVVIAALIMMGCASVRLVARETNPKEKEAFVNECGWSMDLEGGKTEIRVGERETLGAVKLHTNYLYALGSVLSLGIWMPFDITYEVNK
jgi:hypothetical protein